MNATLIQKPKEEVQATDESLYDQYIELARQGSLYAPTSTFPEFFAPKPAPLTVSFGR